MKGSILLYPGVDPVRGARLARQHADAYPVDGAARGIRHSAMYVREDGEGPALFVYYTASGRCVVRLAEGRG